MKKLLPTIIIILFMLPFVTNVEAEILIQIEDGDSWVYAITASPTINVSFEVVDIDYLGEAEDLVRVNKIIANDTIDTPKISSIATLPILVNCSYDEFLGSADLTMVIENIVSDIVWKTARGNILYLRETVVNTTLHFIDIVFNGTSRTNWQTTILLTFSEEISNPTIIEPLSTGTVKLNSRTIVVEGLIKNVDFLDLGIETNDIEILIEFDETERYEASDLFTYLNTTCRNLTIRPLETIMTKAYFVSEIYSFRTSNIDLVSTLGATEDWIYSFDAGLPLLVVEEKEAVALSKDITIDAIETIRILELIDLDLINSDFEFEGETTTNPTSLAVGLLSVLMATYLIMYVVYFRKKDI